MQVQGASGDDPSGPSIAYQGTWDALQTIKRTEGLAGIYKVREDLTGPGVPGGESPGCVRQRVVQQQQHHVD